MNDLEYVILCDKLFGGRQSELTLREHRLVDYCIAEGFFEVTGPTEIIPLDGSAE